MRTLWIAFCFFVFPLFFPLCTCHVRDDYKKTPVKQQTAKQNFSDFNEEYSNLNTPDYLPDASQKANGDEWDLSDVDVSEIDPTRKLISFTFDDTPARHLENILAVFASYNETHPHCKGFATLFANGYLCNNDSLPTLSLAKTLNFELGNHTQTHLDLTKLDPAVLSKEIEETETFLQKIDGKTRHLLRPPFGNYNQTVRDISNAPIIHWTIDTLDWTGISADEIYNTVFDNRFSGAIVLMHDGYPNTVTALKRLLPALEEDGYQVVSVSQMAKKHGCTLKNGKVYIRATKQ